MHSGEESRADLGSIAGGFTAISGREQRQNHEFSLGVLPGLQ